MTHSKKVNMPNRKGYTAIGLAVHHLHKTCVEHMLKHPPFHRRYLDYYPGESEHTVREIIMQKYPDLLLLLPDPQMEGLDSYDTDTQLLAALQYDQYDTFREKLDSINPNRWYDEPYHSSLLEIACQMKDRKRFAERFLDSCTESNIKNRVTGMPLLHAPARSGNFELLEVLLKKEEIDVSVKGSEERTILHVLAGVSERASGDKKKIEYCLKLLLGPNYIRKKGVDDRDSSENTAVFIAAERGFRHRAILLLKNGADIMALEQGSKMLLPSMLSVMEEILDDCLESNSKELSSTKYSLAIKYPQLLWKLSLRMAESQHLRDLLRHPVISTFLILKWQEIRLRVYFYLVFYITFLLFLTTYILYHESYNTLNYGGVARNITVPFSFNDSYTKSGTNGSNYTSQETDNGLHFLC
jgi:ankyrin repeat protein